MPTWCNKVIYWCILSSICFGYIRPLSGALGVKLQHMVFCTELLDRWWSWEPHRTHDLRSGSQNHHPSTKSVQKTICCNSTSNAPDDGRMRPKHVELRFLFGGAAAQRGPWPPHSWGFYITQRRITIGRTSLDEWSARHKYFYLTTHNTQHRHPCPWRDSNQQSKQASGRRPTP